MPPSNWLVWDRIRDFTRSNRIFQQERILQDQPSIDRLMLGGDLAAFSAQSSILEQTNLSINRLERYRDYTQMDYYGELSLALDLYADEISLCDPERKHSLVVRANSRRIREELEDLYYNTLLSDRYIRPIARYLCKFGDCPMEIITDQNRSGVSSIKPMIVENFTRIETRWGDLVGFFYQDEVYPEPIFMHPWSVMHLRLTSFENLFAPYGISILNGSRKVWKQLRLMEDGALIYRITRAPEKRKYKIPVGIMPAKEVAEYLTGIARMFKRQRFYNPSTATFDERYSPIVQEDDFFLPQRPDGSGPDIDILAGGENVDKIADIEYFQKKMIAPLKIPYARVGIGEGAGEANEKSLSQADAEFAKAVKWVQAEIALGYQKAGIVHLALRGYPIEDIKGFSVSLASSSALDELYRMETWQTRVSVMSDLKDMGWFPARWIVTRFSDLSPDEIEELDAETEEESGGSPGGGGGGMIGGGGGDDMDLGGGGDETADEGGGADFGGGFGGLDFGGDDEAGNEEDLDTGEVDVEEDEPTEELEGYNYDAEDRLLVEMKRLERKEELRSYIERAEKRTGKQNAFTHLLEQKELDGLSKTCAQRQIISESAGEIDDPNQDQAGLLVEWSVDEETRNEAIEDVRRVLKNMGPASINKSDEITPEDIPHA